MTTKLYACRTMTGLAIGLAILALGCGGDSDDNGGGHGNTRELTFPGGVQGDSPRFSPDGTQLAYARDDGDVTAVAVMSSTGAGSRSVATDGSYLTAMAWNADGSRVIYAGDNGIRGVAADGSDDGVLIVNAFAAVGPDLDPAGTRLVYGINGGNIQLADLTTSPVTVTDLAVSGTSPRFSPDGSTIAFWSYDKIQLMDLATRATIAVVTGDTNFGTGGVDWFHDGQRLLAGTDRGIEIITLGPPIERRLLSDVFALYDVDLSPDETEVAYTINGQPSLFVLSGF